MKIGRCDTRERVCVVAEIGNNHEGDVERAHALVEAAAAAGADAVKLQTYRTELFVDRSDPARFDRLRGFELPHDAIGSLRRLAHARDLAFVSTPLDLESVRFLTPLVDAFKVASGDNLFYPLLDAIAASGRPVVVSSGFSDLERIRRSVERLRAGGLRELAVLQCTSSYPSDPGDANLAAIGRLAGELECVVGYSDHTLGIDVCVLAVAAGARIVEKHFTLDKHTSDFRDHQLSAEPAELAELVRRIRDVERIVGDGRKRLSEGERALEQAVGRSLAAAHPLERGATLREQDVAWLRPAGGLAPGDEQRVLGRRLVRGLAAGERIMPADVEG